MSEQEEFRIRYFKAVDLSTKILLEQLGSMVRDTFKALGFASPKNYCQKELGWNQAKTESVLSHGEIVYLKGSRANTEYTLLTKVWKEAPRNVTEKIEAQILLLQNAIYNPPVIPNKEHFHELIKNLFHQERELTDAVRETCSKMLEEKMRSLLKPKKKVISLFKKIMDLKEDLCVSSLRRGVHMVCLEFEKTCIRENWNQNFTSELSVSENAPPDFDYLLREVSSCIDNQEKIIKPLLNIQHVYLNIIQRSFLRDIQDELKTAIGDIFPHVMHNWRNEFRNSQHDFEGRLEALGRAECSSYKAACGATLVDVHRWLLMRIDEPLKVNKTAWSLMELATGRELKPQYLLERDKLKPRVVIVYGPAGSGKTWLCHHLREEWCCGRSMSGFKRKLQLLVLLSEENVHEESFSHHLKNVMHPKLFSHVPETDVIKFLCQCRVCFLMDASAGCKPEFTSAVNEVMRHLGQNMAIITARPEARKDVLSATAKFQAEEVYLQPLGDSQRKDLCFNYLKILNANEGEPTIPRRTRFDPSVVNIEKDCELQEDPNTAIGKFLQKLGSEERKDLFYPLPLAYLLWLWLRDPKHLTKVTTISKLFVKVFSVCEQISEKVKQSSCPPGEKMKKGSGKEMIEKLASRATEMFSTSLVATSRRENLIEFLSLYPLLGYFKDCPTLRHKTWHFLHPFLAEVLCAWDTQRINTDFCWKVKVIRYWKQVDNTRSKGSKYVTVTQLLTGFLYWEKNRSIPAKPIVKLYKAMGVADDDFPAWVSLLREGAWVLPLEKAVMKDVMESWKTSWRVPYAKPREVEAMVQLVTHRVYRPREVIIETKAPTEVVCMLTRQPSINVRILKGFQESALRDSLLDALRDAGNVIEFEGKIKEKGAAALSRMTRIHTLDVHLTSVAAIRVFSQSVKKLMSLRELHLHLKIDETTPVGMIPQITVVPRLVRSYLYLHSIKDKNHKWAAEVAKKLECCKKEVYLKNSVVSPDQLQYLKSELHPTVVHISH